MTGQQLKNSILQLAVQGKLVPQDPADEPASVLLERIREEKEQLIREKKIKREKNPSQIFRGDDGHFYERVGKTDPVCIDEELPFEIPETWEWARLGAISTYAETKKKVKAQDADPNLWGLDLEDVEKGGNLLIRKTVGERKAIGDKTYFQQGDILYSKLRPYLQKILVAPENGICTPELVPFSLYGNLSADYIVAFLKCPYVNETINAVTYGVKMPRVNTTTMTSLLVPLPPLAEQQRIVAKIEELLPFVAHYEQSQNKLEKLNTTFPDQLKKSILQEAVQGKLVPQDPADEPASILLERIRAEKEQLIKEGKIKREKNPSQIFRGEDGHFYERIGKAEPVCIDEELPFEIPETWEWARLNDICVYIQRGKSPKYSTIEQIPVISQKCVQWAGFSIEKAKFIDPDSLTKYTLERFLQNGDLLWNSTGLGTLGRVAIYNNQVNPFKAAVADSHVTIVRLLNKAVIPDYIYFYLANPSVQNVIEDQSDGTTKQKELATNTIKQYLTPIPPLAEQQRIVEKLEQILSLCEHLTERV